MPETAPETQSGTPPEQTATGEIKDQSQATQTETTKETQPSKDTTGGDKPSLLNDKGEAKPAPGAPEKYEDFKAPEGFELDTGTMEKATPIFKELGLSQPQAQRLVDFYSEISKDAADAPYKLWQDTQDKWTAEIKADPEIGGKLDQVRTTVARAIDGLGDPKLAADFRQAMDFTGAGNNPAFVRAFYRLAQKVTEGQHVAGGKPSVEGQRAPGQGRPSPAQAMYPKLPSA